MQVLVRLYAELRQALGQKEMVVSLTAGTTVEGLLHYLAQELEGKSGKEAVLLQLEKGGVLILVNGKDASLTGGLDTLLTQDMVVDLMPPLAGGQG